MEVGIEKIEVYIWRYQNMVEHFIATSNIMDLCLETERHPGYRVAKRWWEQKGQWFVRARGGEGEGYGGERGLGMGMKHSRKRG